MVYYILLLILLIIIPTLIMALKRGVQKKLILCLSQIYNFSVAFFGWIIYFIPMIFLLKANIYLWYILAGIIFLIIFLILIIPINVKVKKKIDINAVGYIILSVFTIILGFSTSFMLSNL